MRSFIRFSILIFTFLPTFAGEFDPPDIEIDMTQEAFRSLAEEWQISPIAVTRQGKIILAGEPNVLALLDYLGVEYVISVDRELKKIESAIEAKRVPGSYFDPDSFEMWVTQLVNAHPTITRLIEVGTTVQNRPIWAIKISDNPDLEEFEPEMRIIGNIHGNEKSGLMVCTDVMEWILTNYGSNPQATRLVDESELWFMPMVNPDGNATDSRTNAHSVDLNRNFEGPAGNWGGPYAFSEPETQAVRSLSVDFDNVFVLGLTFHSGEACFNSVWNYSLTADLPDLANFFSSRTGGTPCFNSGGCAVPAPDSLAEAYQDGCTYPDFWYVYGADWYATFGDTNDWAYYFESTLDTTIEVTESYTPSASQIPIYTEQHRYGVLNYLSRVFQGIHGLVTDLSNGNPLAAEITVNAFPKAVMTDATVGDYHRFCVPGSYSITVTAPGYMDQTISNIVVEVDSPTHVDVQMVSEHGYAGLIPFWPGAGPYDSNGNQRIDIVDLLYLL